MVSYTGPSVNQGGVIGNQDATYFLPEVWLAEVIRARVRNFNLANQTMAAPFSGNKGDTIKIPYIGRLKANKKLAGSPFVFETRSEGEFRMVVDRYSYAAFSVDKKLDLQSHVDLGAQYMVSIGEALAEDIEYALLAERATFISFDTANNRIQSAAPIAYADILAAFSRAMELDTNPANWTLNVGPLQLASLFNVNEFIQSGTYNSGNIADIRSGTIVGTILGSPVVLNQSIRRNTATGLNLGGFDYQDLTSAGVTLGPTPGFTGSEYLPTQYGSDRFSITLDDFTGSNYHSALYLHKEAMFMAVQLAPSMNVWYDNNYGETRFTGEQIYDIKVRDPQLGIVIETDEENLI